MSNCNIYEAELPEKIGVSIKVLRELRNRNLVQGTDWKKNARGAVLLTLAAAVKLGASLGLDAQSLAGLAMLVQTEGSAELENDTKKLEAAPENSPTEVVQPQLKFACFLRKPVNQNMVIARMDGEQINVKLKKPRRFKHGQKIPVEHCHHNVWKMVRVPA